jgi:hypothetical protein
MKAVDRSSALRQWGGAMSRNKRQDVVGWLCDALIDNYRLSEDLLDYTKTKSFITRKVFR